ncbi:MAG: 6-phosphofructokinase, partial [Caldiserica bacterium]|nr:6-phosphofructokinase [Caldisericota bacterium]
VKNRLKLKARWEKPGTTQRVAMDRASRVDIEEAYLVGTTAVQKALEGKSGFMVTLVREEGREYRISMGLVELEKVANQRKPVPAHFINEEGNDVTEDFISYARPLIGGPLHPYIRLKKVRV